MPRWKSYKITRTNIHVNAICIKGRMPGGFSVLLMSILISSVTLPLFISWEASLKIITICYLLVVPCFLAHRFSITISSSLVNVTVSDFGIATTNYTASLDKVYIDHPQFKDINEPRDQDLRNNKQEYLLFEPADDSFVDGPPVVCISYKGKETILSLNQIAFEDELWEILSDAFHEIYGLQTDKVQPHL